MLNKILLLSGTLIISCQGLYAAEQNDFLCEQKMGLSQQMCHVSLTTLFDEFVSEFKQQNANHRSRIMRCGVKETMRSEGVNDEGVSSREQLDKLTTRILLEKSVNQLKDFFKLSEDGLGVLGYDLLYLAAEDEFHFCKAKTPLCLFYSDRDHLDSTPLLFEFEQSEEKEPVTIYSVVRSLLESADSLHQRGVLKGDFDEKYQILYNALLGDVTLFSSQRLGYAIEDYFQESDPKALDYKDALSILVDIDSKYLDSLTEEIAGKLMEGSKIENVASIFQRKGIHHFDEALEQIKKLPVQEFDHNRLGQILKDLSVKSTFYDVFNHMKVLYISKLRMKGCVPNDAVVTLDPFSNLSKEGKTELLLAFFNPSNPNSLKNEMAIQALNEFARYQPEQVLEKIQVRYAEKQ